MQNSPHLVPRRPEPSPVRLTGQLDPDLSRWKWLVKWFLAIPHVIVLLFLWIAFIVMTIVAWFAIVFTGRYPRRIFDFNVGVMRWSWRVHYYASSVMGTDKYPPFTLQEAPYPATLQIDYPEHLSQGLVWVKSWLLAIPHLLIIVAATTGIPDAIGAGVAGVLVLVAVVWLLFTGVYPKGLHDLLMGMQRWGFRVGAYVALMTDVYPPFRLDMGPDEPTVQEQEIS